MILRIFRAIVHDGKQNEFQRFFLGKALPNIRLQTGLMSVSVGLPVVESPTEFSMVMVWRDLDALKAFTGENWRQAVIDPDEVHLLKATHLYHYNLAEVWHHGWEPPAFMESAMEKRKRTGVQLQIAGLETVMEGADMRAIVLTLVVGESVPWHYHSEITDKFFCLEGPVIVETRAPNATRELKAGEDCSVPPKTAHRVHGKDNGPCRYLLLQGVGVYDNMPAGD